MAPVKGIGKRAITLLWKIKNSCLVETLDLWSEVMSPVFEIRAALKEKFFMLIFSTKGEYGTNNRCVKLELYVLGDSLSYPIDCEWAFLDSNGATLLGGTERNYMLRTYAPLRLYHRSTYEELLVARKSEFLPDNTLTVKCRIYKSLRNIPCDEFFSCRTLYDYYEHSFEWPIPGFRALELFEDETSQLSFVKPEFEDIFRIKFSFRGASLENSMACIDLLALSLSAKAIVTLELTFMDEERKVFKNVQRQRGYLIGESSIAPVCVHCVATRKELLEKKFLTLGYIITIIRCNSVFDDDQQV